MTVWFDDANYEANIEKLIGRNFENIPYYDSITNFCNWQVLLQYFRQIKVRFLSAYILRTYEVLKPHRILNINLKSVNFHFQ